MTFLCMKKVDVNQATYDLDGTSLAPTLLNGLIPGSNEYNRVGRKITMDSIWIHGFFACEDTATGADPSGVRFLLVYDNQANGAAPTWSDVILSVNSSGTTQSGAFDMPNSANQERFEILVDQSWSFPFWSLTAGASDDTAKMIDMFVPLDWRQVVYNAGTAGTIADIQSGSLYAFWVTTNVIAAQNIDFNGAYRLNFIDV